VCATHQPFTVAECHPGRAVLVLQEAHVVAAVHQVVPPRQALPPPVLHREVFGHQMRVEGQVEVKVLPVGRQSVEQPGARRWTLRGFRAAQAGVRVPRGSRGRVPCPAPPPAPASSRPAMLEGVAEEVPVLIHPHRHRQLVVVQVGQEFLFYGIGGARGGAEGTTWWR